MMRTVAVFLAVTCWGSHSLLQFASKPCHGNFATPSLLSIQMLKTKFGFDTVTNRKLESFEVDILQPPQQINLPWSNSIENSKKLSYMPMLNFQLQLIKSMGMEQIPLDESFIHRKSAVKTARIGSMSFRNDKFRKVRMTYFDAGDNVQVFNTLWYPSYEYDAPLLGVDLISLGKNRVLSVIDFQPLYPTTEYHDKHIEHLTSIRQKYPELHGTLSGKIYDDTSFFSKNMLFGRFKDESQVDSVVLPAFQEYLERYLSSVNACIPNSSEESMNAVKKRQQDYDIYSALKDPAVGLFEAYFGKEWSDSFVHDFLFSLCRNSPVVNVPVHQYKIDDVTGAVKPVPLSKN